MEAYRNFPVASDRMGAIWTFSTIENLCVLEFGPAGTTHYAIDTLSKYNGEDRAHLFSTHMTESDITFGKVDTLIKAIREIDDNLQPKYIIILSTSVSSIIGGDIFGVIESIQPEVNATLIGMDIPGLKEDYPVGVSRALQLLVEEIVQEPTTKIDKYNILGSTVDSFHFESDRNEIQRMMEAYFGKKVHTIFTAYSSVDDIEKAAQASCNIVLQHSAIAAAKKMEQKYGIPYVYVKPIGTAKIEEWVHEIQEKTGWDISESVYQKEREQALAHIQQVKRILKAKGLHRVAIIGDYDVVIGMQDLCAEFGLKIEYAEVIHGALPSKIEGLLVRQEEESRENTLAQLKPEILLSDGVSLSTIQGWKRGIQISNPNVNAILVYPYTPFVGYRGISYVLEKIINQ